MINLRRLAISSLGCAVILGMSATPALASTPSFEEQIQTLSQSNQGQVLFVDGYVDINNATKKEVYDFVSDMSNDHLWYPGTLSSVLVSGNGGPGSKYKESIVFGGQPAEITATVLATSPYSSFWFTSNGLLTNLTKYTLTKPNQTTVRFRMSSVVQVPEGVTQEAMQQYMSYTFQMLLGNLGKTGDIHVPAN